MPVPCLCILRARVLYIRFRHKFGKRRRKETRRATHTKNWLEMFYLNGMPLYFIWKDETKRCELPATATPNRNRTEEQQEEKKSKIKWSEAEHAQNESGRITWCWAENLYSIDCAHAHRHYHHLPSTPPPSSHHHHHHLESSQAISFLFDIRCCCRCCLLFFHFFLVPNFNFISPLRGLFFPHFSLSTFFSFVYSFFDFHFLVRTM